MSGSICYTRVRNWFLGLSTRITMLCVLCCDSLTNKLFWTIVIFLVYFQDLGHSNKCCTGKSHCITILHCLVHLQSGWYMQGQTKEQLKAKNWEKGDGEYMHANIWVHASSTRTCTSVVVEAGKIKSMTKRHLQSKGSFEMWMWYILRGEDAC